MDDSVIILSPRECKIKINLTNTVLSDFFVLNFSNPPTSPTSLEQGHYLNQTTRSLNLTRAKILNVHKSTLAWNRIKVNPLVVAIAYKESIRCGFGKINIQILDSWLLLNKLK